MTKRSLNYTTIFGALIAVAVVYYGGIRGVKSPYLFFDPHAILLVVGGTIAAALIAYPLPHLAQVFDFILFGVFRYRKTNYVTLIEEFADVQQAVLNNDSQIMFRSFSHPFLAESVALLMKRSLSYDETESLLQDRVFVFNRRYLQDAKILNSIAKYPPAFGLLGATTGMISLVTTLGGFAGAAAIGQGIATALVATFWGIAMTNFIFLPLADNAQKAFQSDEFTRTFIKEGVLLIKANVSRKYLIEKLSGMLPLDLRSAARGSFAAFPNSHEQINVVEIFANHKKKQLGLKQNAGVVSSPKAPEAPAQELSDPFFHSELHSQVENSDTAVVSKKKSQYKETPENLQELRKQYQKRGVR